MNKLFAIGVSILLIAGCAKSPSTMDWFQGDFDTAVSNAGNKLVMVEFFTDS
ncbi:MAG: hypothetical protein HQ510_08040 [Candidatus Marinimicrobia bacterium]|nr:hypothetical protein [Candidatus Neomarinimicrobiota bacterium]